MVHMVSSNAGESGSDSLAQHRNAITAARDVGAVRVVYTSHMAANEASAFPPARDHAATEEMLRQSGLAWTALRHGFYAESGIALMGDALKTGVLEAPEDGKVAWTTCADLAEADAIILAEEGRHDGPTLPLTASEALDMADLADIGSALLDSPIRRKILSHEDLRARMAARGAPAGAASIAIGLYIASRNGEFTTVDPTLERLLGRPPISIRDLIARKIDR